MNELAGNIDAYRISTFLHKPRGGKLRFGPIWDLNIGYGRQGRVPWTDWIANYNDYVSQDAWMVPLVGHVPRKSRVQKHCKIALDAIP